MTLFGAIIGNRLSEQLRTNLSLTFGVTSMAMIVKMGAMNQANPMESADELSAGATLDEIRRSERFEGMIFFDLQEQFERTYPHVFIALSNLRIAFVASNGHKNRGLFFADADTSDSETGKLENINGTFVLHLPLGLDGTGSEAGLKGATVSIAINCFPRSTDDDDGRVTDEIISGSYEHRG